MPDEIDWDAVELDFRAGVLPLTAVAVKFGISVTTLKTKAVKFGWERKAMDPLLLKKAHGIASSPSPAKFGMDSNLNPADLDQAAALTAASVLLIHRKDVQKLREIAATFSAQLCTLTDATTLANPEEAMNKLKGLIFLLGKDTPMDLLEKLSRVMVRLVTIERQAFGLDVMPNPDPDAETTNDKVQSQVNKLWEQVQQIQREKTAAANTVH